VRPRACTIFVAQRAQPRRCLHVRKQVREPCRGFGSGENGHHLAVDIDGERGADVLAAAPGIVGYVGHELRGYGNMVLLIHAGGLVTLYGHNQRLYVLPGERVEQGQAIAELGSTGHSMGPHLHFELIHDGRNCDPLALFRPTASDLPARMPAITPSVWQPDQARPDAVRCKRRVPHPHHDEDDAALGVSEPSDKANPSG
jgi:murein DD-endopeptidase MepM/ murein hydrolase activator NlpD